MLTKTSNRLLITMTLGSLALISATNQVVADEANEGNDVEVAKGWQPAFEVNVLWPFFPGGFTDLKLLLPLTATRGDVVLGLHSDFGWRNSREENAGNVAIIAAKIGYRQFIATGFHLDVTVNIGWRQERDNPFDETTLNAFIGRLWAFGGYQHDLSSRWYVNARGGLGVHLWRTDKFGDEERVLVPAGDVNVGVRF